MKHLALTLVALALIVTGCKTSSEPEEPVSFDGSYELIEVAGISENPDAKVSLTIEGDTVAGNGPINRWNGTLDGNKLGLLITTKMAGPPELMKIEDALLQALTESELSIEGNDLLVMKNGIIAAEFQRSAN
ncbi:META domain-containing protein [Coraliomargarita akajimensis]|uniref:DUF306 domain-containing protein n=1 Tax=Coraliomargarita akajimensis (strain DSM 45221 / IAM 15411 / JCM 23193 / KCTC 12865 / 04OKA010-24) TaxID=583355 RepID=D5EK38_CORAD|nr:META domain-containing protein [Coraliomargarita akajimensis]ADE54787.1 protein of unknown function DUF306 Meta and HslJ [Coraliomargarita akajimensis DSM 45221]